MYHFVLCNYMNANLELVLMMLREAAVSQKRPERVCYGGSYLATQAAGFP